METIEIKKAKIDSLIYSFSKCGFQSTDKITYRDLLQFLNTHSISGEFNQTLSTKLFQVLNIDETSTISLEEFINGYLQFEEDILKNVQLFNIKLRQEREIYANLIEQCKKYKVEKMNSEGMCEDAKISGEITDIDLKRQIEGIKEIIIKVIYNEKSEEFHFKLGDINNSSMIHKTFEFKPTSRKDHFEFIMKAINENEKIFDIGRKVFPLTEINSQEEYLVEIIIPEIEDEEKIAAFIHAKIILFWSDYNHYERLKRKSEKKLKKLIDAANQADAYLRTIQEIYGELTKKKSDLIIDFNNEKLMRKEGTRLNVDFNNVRSRESKNNKYLVEFNNIREIERTLEPLRVEFNNSKEVTMNTQKRIQT